MINLFLRAKHWQLFLFTFGIPLLFQIWIMFSLALNIIFNSTPNHEEVFDQFKYFPLMIIFFAGGMYGWIGAVGVGLQKFIPDDLKLPVSKFKLTLLFPSCYMVFLICFITYFMFGGVINSTVFVFIIPMHLLSMFCMIYNLYFVSRTYKTAVLQKKLEVGDYIGEFFMIWFFFIGVWILQPKINKMMEQHSEL